MVEQQSPHHSKTSAHQAKRTVRVSNELGIHLRAAGALVQVAGQYDAEIWLHRGASDANAKSIMSVLALAAGRGVELVVQAKGKDAKAAVDAVVDLIECGFEEDVGNDDE